MRWRSRMSARRGARCSRHAEAHILTDECGAPEFFGGGLKLSACPASAARSRPRRSPRRVAHYEGHAPHQVVPAALSFAQATEAGTIYRPDEIAALAEIAHAHGMKVHMDGARFANALVRHEREPGRERPGRPASTCCRSAPPRAARWRRRRWCSSTARWPANMAERRKRAGHLLSKHRFLAAQFEAFLANDCWLRLARHANAMADRLAAGLTAAGRAPVWPVEANLVFVVVPKAVEARLKAAGARYYVRQSESLADAAAAGPVPDPAGGLLRHPRGRDRPVRRACRESVKCLPQRRQFDRRSSAPFRADAGRRAMKVEDFRDATVDLRDACGAGVVGAGGGAGYEPRSYDPRGSTPRLRPPRLRAGRAAALRNLHHAALDRPRSGRPSGAPRPELCAARHRRAATARSASWSTRARATSCRSGRSRLAAREPLPPRGARRALIGTGRAAGTTPARRSTTMTTRCCPPRRGVIDRPPQGMAPGPGALPRSSNAVPPRNNGGMRPPRQ